MNDQDWERIRSIFETRGVTRNVAEARPYDPYRHGDKWVSADGGPFDAIPREQRRATITKDVNARGPDGSGIDGLVMFKHAVNGVPYPPQLRPDKDPDVWGHDHAVDYATSPSTRTRHEAGKKHEERAEPRDGWHEHRGGKYKLPASPRTTKVYPHAHPIQVLYPRRVRITGRDVEEVLRGSDRSAHNVCRHKPQCRSAEEHTLKHVQKHHDGHDDTGGLTHFHKARITDPARPSYGQRIDMHPLTAERLENEETPARWFFCIEGNLKNDALVSREEFTFNVPSVTLWPAPELRDFARERLQGVPCFIVPDSDWASNPRVALQAFSCRQVLRSYGVDAHIAAPTPEPRDCKRHDAPKGAKRGVDDFTGDRCRVSSLVVVERETSPGFRRWAHTYFDSSDSSDVRGPSRDCDVVETLALLADAEGRVEMSLPTIARAARVHRDTVKHAFDSLIEEDGDASPFIYSERTGKTLRVRTGDPGRPHRYVEDLPIVVLRDDIRATEERVSLGRFLARIATS